MGFNLAFKDMNFVAVIIVDFLMIIKYLTEFIILLGF